MKKILLILTGGTIASAKGENGLAPTLSADDFKALGLEKICRYEILELFNVDSTFIGREHWRKIAETINDRADDFDGFVTAHGTDTLAYTSAALYLMLGKIEKPVVLTGSQSPLGFENSDAEKNLKDAFLFAVEEKLKGVYISFNGKLISGLRAKKVHSRDFDAFESVNFPLCGEIIDGAPVIKNVKFFDNDFSADADTSVAIAKPLPSSDAISSMLGKYKAVVVEGFGMGSFPYTDKLLSDIRSSESVVALATSCLRGGTNTEVYAVGNDIAQAGVISCGALTPESSAVALMWALANSDNRDGVISLFNKIVAD